MSSHPVLLGSLGPSARFLQAQIHPSRPLAAAGQPKAAGFAPLLYPSSPARVPLPTPSQGATLHRTQPLVEDDSNRRCARHQMLDIALDTAARQASQAPAGSHMPLGSAGEPSVSQAVGPEARTRASLEDLLPALVRRVAWSGDARSGSVLLELGAGALSGAKLFIRAEGGRVHVRISASSEVDLAGWRARIATRLAARGLDIAGVDVDG